MTNFISALIFAAALMFGLGTGSALTYACNEQTAQAEAATGLVQLAMDDAEDAMSDDAASDDAMSDDAASDDATSDDAVSDDATSDDAASDDAGSDGESQD